MKVVFKCGDKIREVGNSGKSVTIDLDVLPDIGDYVEFGERGEDLVAHQQKFPGYSDKDEIGRYKVIDRMFSMQNDINIGLTSVCRINLELDKEYMFFRKTNKNWEK